jgi:Dockerin type I domain
VTGITVANYGPVTISGSGTSYTITFAQAITTADRVTVTIGNAGISTYTRRLDVLPGDVNDDGVVNAQDLTLVRNNFTSTGALYDIFDDIDGSGVVDITDYNLVRRFGGQTLHQIPT